MAVGIYDRSLRQGYMILQNQFPRIIQDGVFADQNIMAYGDFPIKKVLPGNLYISLNIKEFARMIAFFVSMASEKAKYADIIKSFTVMNEKAPLSFCRLFPSASLHIVFPQLIADGLFLLWTLLEQTVFIILIVHDSTE